jgi:hypothetical protein
VRFGSESDVGRGFDDEFPRGDVGGGVIECRCSLLYFATVVDEDAAFDFLDGILSLLEIVDAEDRRRSEEDLSESSFLGRPRFRFSTTKGLVKEEGDDEEDAGDACCCWVTVDAEDDDGVVVER